MSYGNKTKIKTDMEIDMDIVNELRGTAYDKDNMPRMKSERSCSVRLALAAADEIERLRDQIFQFKNATPQILSSHNETLKNYVNNTELILQEVREENERLREALKFYVEIDEQYFPKVKSKAAAALKGDE